MRSTCRGCWPRSVHGWADEAILDAYEAERQPITEQVSQLRDGPCAEDDQARAARCRPNIEAAGAEGDALRAEIGARGLRAQRAAVLLRRPELRLLLRPARRSSRRRRRGAAGLLDGRLHAVDRARLPRAALLAGATAARCTTRFGPGYTLLRFDPRASMSAPLLGRRAARAACRSTLLDVDARRRARPRTATRWCSCRADQHVAWRGDAVPDDPARPRRAPARRRCSRLPTEVQ